VEAFKSILVLPNLEKLVGDSTTDDLTNVIMNSLPIHAGLNCGRDQQQINLLWF
jgi:hypothetical protein